MNTFDKQRIENAIWTLMQYEYELIEIIEKLGRTERDSYTMYSVLEDIKTYLEG